MADGQLAVNTNATSPGLFFKDAAGDLVKVGPVHVGTSAPNSSPAGSSGNALGEQWLDTSGGGYVFKVWDGSAWRSEAGQFVIAATGTATAPSITFTGDTNTGLYSPGADQVAISTGGTGRLFVDSTGRLGVGTSTPGVAGEFVGAGGDGVIRSLRNIPTGILSAADHAGRISLGVSTAGSAAYIGGRIEINGAETWTPGTAHGSNLVFSTVPVGSTTITERLRITSDGKVGLGSSSPANKLLVSGTSAEAIPAINTFTGGHSAPITSFTARAGLELLAYQSTSGSPYTKTSAIIANSDGTVPSELQFWTKTSGQSSPAQRLHIDSSGRVGIGTTSPSAPLHVTSSIAGGIVNITSTSTSAALVFNDSGTGGNYPKIGSEGNNLVLRGGAVSNAAYIDSAGRLLVGTSSGHSIGGTLGNAQFSGAGAQVHFVSTSTAPSYINLAAGSSGADVTSATVLGRLQFFGYHTNGYDTGARIEAAVDGTPGDGDLPTRLVFSTTADGASSPTERMRISADGTTSLLGDLDIDGSYRSNIVAVAALNIDCSAGNYFTKTISSNSTFTFSNATSSRAISFTLELTHTSGTVTWPASVKWPSDTAPTLTTGKTHLFMFVTDDGGTRWRGAALVDYVN